MSTNYPSGIDSFTRPKPTDPMNNPSHSGLHCDGFDAIEAIETELGTNPSGSVADVKTFLQTEHETDGTHGDITPTSIVASGDVSFIDGSGNKMTFHKETEATNEGILRLRSTAGAPVTDGYTILSIDAPSSNPNESTLCLFRNHELFDIFNMDYGGDNSYWGFRYIRGLESSGWKDFRIEGQNLYGGDITVYASITLPDGYIGLKTKTPANPLDIKADATGKWPANPGVGQLVIRGATDTAKALGIMMDTSENVGKIQVQHIGLDVYPLALQPGGGSVLIGKTSGQGKLDILDENAANDTTTKIVYVRGGSDETLGPLNIIMEVHPSATGGNRFASIWAGDNADYRPLALNAYGGDVVIGATSATAKLDINGDKLRLRSSKTPSSASDTGNPGEICWDENYIYVCVATNTWKRAALSSW